MKITRMHEILDLLSPAPAGWLNLICSLTWGSAPLHPRAGSPAEHLGWGARLYAVARYRGLVSGSTSQTNA